MNENTDTFPTYEEMYDRFIAEGVREEVAHRHATELPLLSIAVRNRFEHWWKTSELLDELEVSGLRVSSFQKRFKYRIPCAFLDFDVLWQNPSDDQMLRAVRDGISVIFFADREEDQRIYQSLLENQEK